MMVLVYVLLLCALNIDAQLVLVQYPPPGARYTSPAYRAVGENFTFSCEQSRQTTRIYLWNSTYNNPANNSTITDPWLINTNFEGALAPLFPAELKDRLTDDSDTQNNPKSWSITVKNLQPKDFALYGCYNRDGSSQDTTVTKLRRFSPATSELQLSCSHLQENSAGNCSCESTGANPAPHFGLRVDGTSVGNTTNQVLYVHRVDGGESRAVVDWTSVSRDIEELSCEVIGPTGTSWSQQTTQQLNVKYCTQSFKLNGEATDSVELSREYGEDVRLRCEAAGSPQPVFKWFSDNQELFSTAGVLQLKNLTRNATYTCIAEQTSVIGCSKPRGVVKLAVYIVNPSPGRSGSTSAGVIAGSVVGAMVFLAAVLIVVLVLIRRGVLPDKLRLCLQNLRTSSTNSSTEVQLRQEISNLKSQVRRLENEIRRMRQSSNSHQKQANNQGENEPGGDEYEVPVDHSNHRYQDLLPRQEREYEPVQHPTQPHYINCSDALTDRQYQNIVLTTSRINS